MSTPSTVVVVGSGQAGFQTAASLRGAGFDGRVVLVGDEPGLPYQRPPLSKAFLSGKAGHEALWFRPRAFFDKHSIDLRDGDGVTAIDRATSTVHLASGAAEHYDHLVLATGARARTLRAPGADLAGVVALRTLAHAEHLAERLATVRHAVVVGGGFIGLEFAAVASELGVEVTVLEALPRLMARAVSSEISDFYTRAHEDWGVRIRLSNGVTALAGDERGHVREVVTSDGTRLAADLVVVGVGVEPNADLAAGAGLAVDNGIVVDEHLLTGDPRISAVGDCANFPSQFTGSPIRLESVQNAADQARCVAARLTGDPAPYTSVPWFWSDQRDLKLQMVGLNSGHDQVVIRGDVDQRKFSAFCFRHGRLLGVESVNRPADHMAARKLLAATPDLIADLTPEQVADPSFDLKAYAKEHSPSPTLVRTVRPLRDALRPVLVSLQRDLDETVDLAVLDGPHARFVDQMAAPHRLRAVSAVGAAFPLHATANGKALLAALPLGRAIEILPADLEPLTRQTITSRGALLEHLEQIRAGGVAYDREEHTEGICAVGAVVHGPGGEPLGAISIPVPAHRFAAAEDRITRRLLEARDECAAALNETSAVEPTMHARA
jgi:3-phenylpropionate/trans-cinnamate dioxygenase ferredoxin reductase component